MNFDLSEDELLLRSVAERFVTDRYAGEERQRYLLEQCGFSQANWRLLGELGILAASFPEYAGGLDLGPTAISVIYRALGRGMVVEPMIDCSLLAGGILARACSSVADEWAPVLADGSKRVALAHAERSRSANAPWVATRARKTNSAVALSGTKSFAVGGCDADAYLVSARSSGEPCDADGWSLYLVSAQSDGLEIVPWRMADGSMAATLTFDAVIADAELIDGPELLEQVERTASLARSSEMVGIMERLFEDTLVYLRTRSQFGQPLGSFQAIQHRMTEQYAELEQAKALLDLAIISQDAGDDLRQLDGARAYIGEAALELGHEAIQFHGGMGVSEELSIGHGHKRLLVLSRWPDAPGVALDRFAGLAA